MKNRVCVSVKPMEDLERTDIPFGVYESDMAETVEPLKAADGKKESLFTVQGAVVRMLDLNEDELWRDEWQGKTFFRFEGLSGVLEAELMRFVDSGDYCYTFMGEESPNPFNYGDAEDARFSRSAFYRWWKENPNGLPCPKWFDDLRRADELKQIGAIQPPVECVFELPEEPEECPPWGWSVPPPDDCWEVEHSDECREIEAPKAPAAAPSVVSDIDAPGAELLTDDHEIVPGITVGDVRAMIDANSPAYCPRLLAAIQTKIALMPRESVLRNDTVYERYAKTESVSRLKALGVVNPKDKSRNPDPADLDVNAVARILCRKHKKKEGHPGSL